MFCSNCGKEIDNKAVVCVGCGCATINNSNKPTEIIVQVPRQQKSYLVALLLCLFFGLLGAHRFYTDKGGSGATILLFSCFFSILTIGLTLVISVIWVFIDFIIILCGGWKANGENLV